MAMILHHWGDDDCIRILKNIHKALLDNGKVLIVDRVIMRDNATSFNKMINLNMLVLTDGGQERERRRNLGSCYLRLALSCHI